MKTNLYRVNWTIDLEASCPKDAARKVLRIHRNPESIATVFEVTDPDGERHTVDLLKDAEYPEADDRNDAAAYAEKALAESGSCHPVFNTVIKRLLPCERDAVLWELQKAFCAGKQRK